MKFVASRHRGHSMSRMSGPPSGFPMSAPCRPFCIIYVLVTWGSRRVRPNAVGRPFSWYCRIAGAESPAIPLLPAYLRSFAGV